MARYIKLISLTVISIILLKILLPKQEDNYELKQSFWTQKTFASNEYDVIACGDSRVYRGLSPNVLEELPQNLRFLNLGYSSAGLSVDYLEFVVSKFNPNSKSKILLVGISPNSLLRESHKNEQLSSYLSQGYFNTYRYRYLSKFLSPFAPYKPMQLINNKPKNYQEYYDKSGWVKSDKIESDSTYALKKYKKNLSESQLENEIVDKTIQKLIAIKNSGIHVFAFRMPTTKAMEHLENSLLNFDENILIKKLLDGGINWVSFNKGQYTSYDGSHLDSKSAIAISKYLGTVVKQVLF